jgi:hypothetical protein
MLCTDLVCVSVKLVAKGFTHSLDFMLVGRCTAARATILRSATSLDPLGFRSFRGPPSSELDMCVEFGREISDRLHRLTQGAL